MKSEMQCQSGGIPGTTWGWLQGLEGGSWILERMGCAWEQAAGPEDAVGQPGELAQPSRALVVLPFPKYMKRLLIF